MPKDNKTKQSMNKNEITLIYNAAEDTRVAIHLYKQTNKKELEMKCLPFQRFVRCVRLLVVSILLLNATLGHSLKKIWESLDCQWHLYSHAPVHRFVFSFRSTPPPFCGINIQKHIMKLNKGENSQTKLEHNQIINIQRN